MQYDNLVHDFARRTQHNLEVIRRQRSDGQETYEVTQLINSMLGLLVLPQQHYYESIPTIPLAELRRQGWPKPVLDGEFKSPRNLRQLITYLRNSIAHFNIEFTDSNGQIAGIKLWNEFEEQINWRVTLSLEDLEELADRFIHLILEEVVQ